MKLFGEYLIEKGVIDSSALVAGLVEQMKTTPTIAEAVFEKKLLDADKLLKVFKCQIESKLGFVEAAKSLSYWSPQIQTDVDRFIQSKKTPLGEVLSHKGLATVEAITHALDDFLAETDNLKTAMQTASVTLAPAPVSAPAPEAAMSDGGMGLQESWPAESRQTVESALADCTQVPALLNAKAKLHQLSGAARLSGAAQLEALCKAFEGLCNDVSNFEVSKLTDEFKTKISKAAPELCSVIDLWIAGLSDKKTEESLLSDVEIKSRFQNLIALPEVAKFDLSLM